MLRLMPEGRLRRIAIFTAVLIALMAGFALFDPLILTFARQADPLVYRFFNAITDIGRSGWILIPLSISIAVMAVLFRRETSLRGSALYQHLIGMQGYIAATLCVNAVLYFFIKGIVGRARPKFFDEHGPLYFYPLSFSASDFASFPSGHAATIFAGTTALAFLFPRLRTALLALALLIAASRVFVDKHYFTDIVAGSLLGAWVAHAVRDWFAARGIAFIRRAGGRIEPRSSRVLDLRLRTLWRNLYTGGRTGSAAER